MYSFWEPEEDQILINYVNDSPANISEAIETVAEDLGRSYSGVFNRYYKVVRNHTKLSTNGNKTFKYRKNIPRVKKRREITLKAENVKIKGNTIVITL